jgi:hypothetical protein
MARTYEDVRALRQLDSEVQGLPPGYIAGGDLTLTENGGAFSIDIDPVIANIRGKQVGRDTTYTITEGDFASSRNPGCWYYVYLTDSAGISVDPRAPSYDSDTHAYYHPTQNNYRNIGKLYISDAGDYVFCTPKIDGANEAVLIAASTYKGDDAQYYCTGADDQHLINAAFTFLSEAYSGGVARLTTGQFNITAAISVLSKCTMAGEGRATQIVKDCNDYAIKGVGTSGAELSRIVVKDLYITKASTDTNAVALVYMQYVDDLYIGRCIIDDGRQHSVYAESCDRLQIEGNTIARIGTSGIYTTGCTGHVTNNDLSANTPSYDAHEFGIAVLDSQRMSITNNRVHDLAASSSVFIGICVQYSAAATEALVEANQVWSLSNAAGQLIGIHAQVAHYVSLIGNRVLTLDASDTGTAQWSLGMSLRDCLYAQVVGNMVADCDSASASYGIGIDLYESSGNTDHCQIVGNYSLDNSGLGIWIEATCTSTLVSGNYCFNNGSDSGTANTNEHNFDDDGTNTKCRI